MFVYDSGIYPAIENEIGRDHYFAAAVREIRAFLYAVTNDTIFKIVPQSERDYSRKTFEHEYNF